jgi:hypothetical protein
VGAPARALMSESSLSNERHSFSCESTLSETTSPVSLRINSPVFGSAITKLDKETAFDFLLVTIAYEIEGI